MKRAAFPFLAALSTMAVCWPARAQSASPQEVRSIAERAYTFAYPMVLMEFTRRNALQGGTLGGRASENRFTHALQFPDDRFRQVIRPNADTLYSSAWLDLSKEPVLLHVPDTNNRYYLMQFLDAWTETFAVPGKRTTGAGEGWFAIVGPGWQGRLPERAQRIDAPTNMVWLIGRTQTNNASDYANVHAIQRGYLLMPLSFYPDGPPPRRPDAPSRAGSGAGTPPEQVARLSAAEFFSTFAQLLTANPPHAADEPMMKELARIGIAPGKPWQADKALGADARQAFEDGAQSAAKRLDALEGRTGQPGKTGWTGGGLKAGRYGTDYNTRAAVARIGLGALPQEDAVYMLCHQDAEGHPLDGANKYRLHFDQGKTPPVRAFWSVTMYTDDGYFVANPIHRFAIGDRDPLVANPDGSLDLVIQREAPGADRAANWLPAPAGKFNLALRLYWPEEAVLRGVWTPPALLRESR